MPPEGRTYEDVRVRMYRQGLGDCFLLSFPREGGGRFHLMIDFGVLLGTSGAAERMKDVARSIARETGATEDGRVKGRIDVLVATHEHWDHLSGFLQAHEELSALVEVGEVWLAWTEDPGHPLARELGDERMRRARHLTAVALRMKQEPAMLGLGEGIESLMGFFGEAGPGGRSVRHAMEALAAHPRVVYRRPGEPALSLEGVPAVRVYVLGPPEDRTLLRRSDPTKTGREVYDHDASLSLADTFFAGLALDEAEQTLVGDDARLDPEAAELAFPFDRQHRIPPAEAAESPFFREVYGFGEGDAGAWRRIGADWLVTAADLALKLDNDTNNTSLALAFELGDDGPVLLFPADAQVGNWLSWEALAWEPDAAGRKAPVTTDDLLRRTVLYKVGHHGSHNSTMREKGLEKMTSPELVALIPVERGMAAKKKWEMPYGPLLERLLERTRGRVLRADDGRSGREDAIRHGLTDREWEEFERRTPEDDETKLWIDYHVPMPTRRPNERPRPRPRPRRRRGA